MNEKIAITGASGFVGKNLSTYLTESGYNVFPISREGNSFNTTALHQNNFFAVIHLAGKAHDLKNVSNPGEYYKDNTELTKQIFDYFISSSAEVFIFMSSVKAAADEVHDLLTEDVAPDPKTHYGKSKRLAEEYILQNLPESKRVYILRPCMIHGPGNKGNLNLLFKLVSKGIPWPLGAFENKRSFCSIGNLCFVVKELLHNKNIPSGIYNVADDEPLSTNTLISLISRSVNKRERIWNLPKALVTSMAKVGDVLRLPLNSERLQKLTESYVVSNAKLKAAIGKPLPISAREGLAHTIQTFSQRPTS